MTAHLRRGFTLIELLIVIAIIGILTAMSAASYGNAQAKARDAKRKSDLKQIQAALELYKADYGHYPCSAASGANPAANGAWDYSTAGTDPWILNDEVNCPAGGVSFSTYMRSMPKDPVNSGSYFYLYGDHPWWGCPYGQWYVLYTYLENSNDPERSAVTNPKICSYTASSVGWGGNAYILTNP